MKDDYEQLEKEVLDKAQQRKNKREDKMKVTGKSVFQLQDLMKRKKRKQS